MRRNGSKMEEKLRISFTLRVIQNHIKTIICRGGPKFNIRPQSQLQGGILGFLYNHQNQAVYQRDIEKEFRISRATATNTLQVMEKNGLIVRKSQDKDARLKRIFMTEAALSNHIKVEAHMRMMDERMLRGMSDADVEELNRLLGILMKNLEQMREELSDEADTEEEQIAASETKKGLQGEGNSQQCSER